ncbi:MAG: SGNH/GDSL hydrolase family protein [Brachybacterium sp.]|nr:SGNH/GDSL hydrolase family protein [Brachybacterium sp.]
MMVEEGHAGPILEDDDARPHPWTRFVAMGDSFTEGIGDPDSSVPGGHRGWADRVAEALGRGNEDFSYANLAIRGRKYQQIIDEQLDAAIALEPDLVSLAAGGNDVIRLGDPDAIAAEIDEAVGRITEIGASILLVTGPDVGSTPVLSLIRGRTAIYNENIRTVARRHGAYLLDLWGLRVLTEESMWAPDRLHFSPAGHQTIAIEALDTLGVEHELQTVQAVHESHRTWRATRASDWEWARTHFGPWVMRRLRQQSSGDHVLPKRPQASAVFGEGMPPGSATEEHH